MTGNCQGPCATITERRRGMMNKFQGMIDNYDNEPFRQNMKCPPAVMREMPTLVERQQMMACFPVACPMPCGPCPSPCGPCPSPCGPCPSPCAPMCPPLCPPRCPPSCPPMCMPCVPCCPPCPPSNGGNGEGNNQYMQGKRETYPSRELRGGLLLTGCDCTKLNGLQHDCPRTECRGAPPCLLKPKPDCRPSGGSGRCGAPPRRSGYPPIEEHCTGSPPRERGPPQPDHEHRAGMPCPECEPPIKYTPPTYGSQAGSVCMMPCMPCCMPCQPQCPPPSCVQPCLPPCFMPCYNPCQ